MPLKSLADRWFVIFGIGAFSFRKDLKKTWRKLMGSRELALVRKSSLELSVAGKVVN
jgi:hypothetical protein